MFGLGKLRITFLLLVALSSIFCTLKLSHSCEDTFVKNPPDQPKFDIGDYVESNGILVPHRYASGQEAWESGDTFLVRSEHPHEYDHASGIFSSIVVNPERRKSVSIHLTAGNEPINWNQGQGRIQLYESFPTLFSELLNTKDRKAFHQGVFRSSPFAKQYALLNGFDPKDFEAGLTTSYWKYVPGYNRSIVADHSVPGRYHIFTGKDRDWENNEFFQNYMVVENGKILFSGPRFDYSESTRIKFEQDVQGVIDFYEKIRKLPKFDPNHCPIVEFQTSGDKHYFLQYHRTRDFKQTTHTLDRPLEEGEFQADFVVGATPKEGVVVQLHLVMEDVDRDTTQLGNYNASYEFHYNTAYRESMSRRQRVLFSIYSRDSISKSVADGSHMSRTDLFAPEISLGIQPSKWIPNHRETWIGETQIHEARVISDGTKAYVKHLRRIQ